LLSIFNTQDLKLQTS